ncbi:MAG: hypothetical protein H7Y86_21610 [Rhizobacter sp.]|nr:hypothetical protein [Ferruginibacter sp.]
MMINLLTRNSGVVKKGEIVFLELTINNTSPATALSIYKLRPQISFPSDLVSIPDDGHVLPKGWTILVKKDGVVTLSNGTDIIPENDSRTILIAMKGLNSGGPITINGNLYFSNGTAPGTSNGAAPKQDKTVDNFSTTSIKVI